MSNQLANQCKEAMEKRLKSFEQEIKSLRTGRASLSVLDSVRVDYYGTPSPINQVATLATPDARTITITPFEKKLIAEIEKSIRAADIGVQPTNDGNVIRLPFPQLTEDRRKDIVKQLKKMGEEAKVAIRLVRRDANEDIKKQEKDKKIAEDESKRIQGDIQKHTDHYIKVVDDRAAAKEKEIMTL